MIENLVNICKILGLIALMLFLLVVILSIISSFIETTIRRRKITDNIEEIIEKLQNNKKDTPETTKKDSE